MPILRLLPAATLLVLAACNGSEGPADPTPGPGGLRVTLTVPATTPDTAHVYIAGTFNGWNPGMATYRLEPEADGTYAIELPATVRGPIEFKFTLGAWDRVETTANGGDVPNRRHTVSEDGGEWAGSVAGWRQGGSVEREHTATASVSILSDAFDMPQLGRSRRVWLYLPPDYEANTARRYPVLYMHDGQNVFDEATSYAGEWGVDETLDAMHAAGELSLIVVAVDHGGTRRFDEYSPWNNAQYGGGEGAEYVDFLVQTLKPHVDAHYRTLPDRANTAIAGSSMGGLISLYATLEHPEVFSRAGVFSPAFWVVEDSVMAWTRARAPFDGEQKLYFVSGALEGQGDAYVRNQEQMIDTLAATGYVDGTDYVAHVRADGEHSEWFWRREFPAAVRWLFGE